MLSFTLSKVRKRRAASEAQEKTMQAEDFKILGKNSSVADEANFDACCKLMVAARCVQSEMHGKQASFVPVCLRL